jgi:hypothetical protein
VHLLFAATDVQQLDVKEYHQQHAKPACELSCLEQGVLFIAAADHVTG